MPLESSLMFLKEHEERWGAKQGQFLEQKNRDPLHEEEVHTKIALLPY